ncbi:MAG: EAL domain-containing protein [Leptospiraceae bacterium]|nr:EAL domain-containing protein [Leptospiraceae bacterium]
MNSSIIKSIQNNTLYRGSWLLSIEGHLKEIDLIYQEFSGYIIEELLDGQLKYIFSDSTFFQFKDYIQKRENTDFYTRHILKNKSEVRLLSYISFFPSSGLCTINFYNEDKIDIDKKETTYSSERKSIIPDFTEKENLYSCEERLLKEKKFYQELLENITSGIVVFNKQFEYDYINPGEIRDKFLRQELIGKSNLEYCKKIEIDTSIALQREVYLKEALLNKENLEFEEEILFPGKNESQYFIRKISPILNESNDVIKLLMYGTEITYRKKAEKEIEYIANHDSLTGLANRRNLYFFMSQRYKEYKNLHSKNVMMLIDLDRFKTINDSLGHITGDLLIQSVAKRLLAIFSNFPGTKVFRLGGDEFIIVLFELKKEHIELDYANKIIEVFRKPFLLNEHELFIGTSIGINYFDNADLKNLDEIIKNADIAMYNAKASGRNTYKIYTNTMENINATLLKYETEIYRAYQNKEFVIYYQPRISAFDKVTIIGAEALLRWKKNDNLIIYPSEFIDVAENAGILLTIGNDLIFQVMKEFQALIDECGKEDLILAINISRKQFYQEGFPELIFEALEESKFKSSNLIIEIKENTIMDIPEESSLILNRVCGMGIRIAIDDYGSGYSSLSQIKNYPIHIINIGRSFIKEVMENYQDAAITTSIITMAKSLGMNVHVEGIENEEQVDFIQYLKADSLQGFYYQPAIEIKKFAEMIKD